jgi:GalNAc-alpha-(1->4)-GalNAc-alpha-(1->3)-diNAcBac-PP-undecaprenol alpha-1,4-N-acetyl-D-galactosaminyltransferase
MRVILTIPSLSSGGAERVLTILANGWAAKGWDVSIISLDDPSWQSFYPLDPRIGWIRLGLMIEAANPLTGVWNNLKRLRGLRSAIRRGKPQEVISFIDTMNVLTLLATRGLKVKVLVSERSDPRKHDIGKFWKWLRMQVYPWADFLVAQNQQVRSYFQPVMGDKICIIQNPVPAPAVEIGETPYLPARPVVLTVGRLVREKGYDLLIEAFARAVKHNPGWQMLILGEGLQRTELEKLAASRGLNGLVHLPGRVKNPYDYYHRVDLFVLPSRYEGLPNALCEAMVHGLPVIAANCSAGVSEVVEDGVNGVLVPPEDTAGLSAALENLMADPERRDRLGQQAARIGSRFGVERVMQMWEEVMQI